MPIRLKFYYSEGQALRLVIANAKPNEYGVYNTKTHVSTDQGLFDRRGIKGFVTEEWIKEPEESGGANGQD